MSSNLPSVFSGALAASPASRDLARIERATSRQVAVARGKALIVQEQHSAAIRAVETVAMDALFAGANLTQQAKQLSQAIPGSEHLSGRVLDAASTALSQVLTDTARDLRS